jgi:hypothetical protein
MKKYLLLVFLGFAMLISNAQNLVIRDVGGNDVTNTTINIDVHPSVVEESHEYTVANESNMDIPVNALRYENNCTTGSGEFFCWTVCLGAEECKSESVRGPLSPEIVSPNTISTTKLLTDFQPSFDSDEDGLEGTASYTYVLFDNSNPNDSSFVTLVYNIDYTVGINEINENAISNIYPNPAQNSIQFNLANNITLAQFEIYSMVGKKVKQVNVENAQGKISIDINELAPGIYFLSEKNSSVTRKFIVSR